MLQIKNMINVQRLAYAYSPEKTIRFPDFTINKGGQCLLLGESGSGKTTLLHLAGGLLRSQGQGTISVAGTDITQLSEPALDHFRGRRMGFIFQKNHLITALTVRKNLLMAPFLSGLAQHEQRVTEVLRELGLEEKADADVRKLSQGQAQRVAIARAVINKPDIILADEPTSALDDKNCYRVIELLLHVAQHHQSTLLIATHDLRLKSMIQQQVVL